LAVFLGALAASSRAAGPSPIAWFDTFNDQEEVSACVNGDSCTLTGMGTSIPGLVHAVGWLELRTLLAWFGMTLDGAHATMQVLDGLAVVLVFYLGAQLGGPLTGVLAAWILVELGTLGVSAPALYNSRPLLFLGAVFVLACTAAVARPGALSVALAALVAAVMANTHLACVVTGASLLWVAALARQQRWLLAVWGVTVFATAAFIIAPPSWLDDARSVLQHRVGGSTGTPALGGQQVIRWALFSVGAFAVSFASRAPAAVAYRRRAQGALSVLVPFLAPFLIATHFGIDASAKYLAHVKAACALAAALPLGLAATALLRAVSSRTLVIVERALPFALAVVLAIPTPLTSTAADSPAPTMVDLASTLRILHTEHGWDLPRVVRGLKAADGMLTLEGIHQLRAQLDDPGREPEHGRSTAVLVRLAEDELARPLPQNWTIVRRAGGWVWTLIMVRSRIDWEAFEVCERASEGSEPHCEPTGLRPVQGAHFSVAAMPRADVRSRGTLALRLRLHDGIPGSTDEIFMPRLPSVCAGRIAGLSTDHERIDADRRSAMLSDSAADNGAVLDLEWEILSPECDGIAYDGVPPFFLEGDAEDIRPLEAILRARENGR
jgi:hypothetical protein